MSSLSSEFVIGPLISHLTIRPAPGHLQEGPTEFCRSHATFMQGIYVPAKQPRPHHLTSGGMTPSSSEASCPAFQISVVPEFSGPDGVVDRNRPFLRTASRAPYCGHGRRRLVLNGMEGIQLCSPKFWIERPQKL